MLDSVYFNDFLCFLMFLGAPKGGGGGVVGLRVGGLCPTPGNSYIKNEISSFWLMASMLAISQHAGYKYIYFLQNLDI